MALTRFTKVADEPVPVELDDAVLRAEWVIQEEGAVLVFAAWLYLGG